MTITEIQNLSDEELRVRCAKGAGFAHKFGEKYSHLDPSLRELRFFSTSGENIITTWWKESEVEVAWQNMWRYLPKFEKDLNACLEFESILLSEPEPEKGQIGRSSSHLEAYQYALCALEPDKPLWHKSARTKAVAFVFAMQD